MSCGCNETLTLFTGLKGDSGTNGTNGADGQDGQNGNDGNDGNNGTDGTNAFKYVKEFTSNLDDITVTISQLELAGAGTLPTGFIEGSLPQEYCDLQIQVWILFGSSWRLINNRTIADTGSGVEVTIHDTTGLISIRFLIGDINERVRVIVLG